MKSIAVVCGASVPGEPRFAEAARRVGAAVAEAGCRLVYGGSNLGMMGMVSAAALARGGEVAAVIPTLFSEDIINSQPVSELIRVGSMAERKTRIMQMCDAFVALPGGIGTLDEVSEVMVANQLHQMDKPVVLLDIDGFYAPFLAQLELMRRCGLLRSECRLQAVATVEECMAIVTGE